MKKSKAFGISLLWILLFFGVQLAVSVAASFSSIAVNGIGDIADITGDALPATLVLSNILTPLLALLIVKLGDNKLSSLGIKKISFSGICVSAVFALTLSPVISYLLEIIPIPDNIMEFYDTLMDMVVTEDNMFSVLATVIFAPICEELIFRGAIFNTLHKGFSTVSSVLLTSFLFGLVHLNPVQSSYAFILGIALNLVCIRFNSLWASICCHMCFNLVGGYFDRTKYGQNVQTAILIVCGAIALSLCIWMAATNRKHSRR